MASFAALLTRVSTGSIHSTRYWLKMGGIDTTADSAQMVKCFIRDWPDEHFISKSVREIILAIQRKCPVSIPSICPDP